MLSLSSIARLLASLGDKGLFNSANILQTADVVRRVIFLLFLLCLWPIVRLFFLAKRVKSSATLYALPKQLNLVPRSSRLTVQFFGNYAVELT